MTEAKINEIVAAAVGGTFDEWAAEHPSLAAVIDRIRLTDQTVESLRSTDGYRQAIAAYHRDQNELSLLGELAELAGPILRGILGL
jgi:hypothetical protein